MTDMEAPEQIAIVGMAGRFPGAANVDELWANLRDGVESIRAFSEDELAAAGVDAARRSDPDFVNAGAIMDEADGFDAAFFRMSRREAELTDPQHRVFLESAWAAIEHAGYDPGRCEGRIGVFGGVAANTYFQKNVMTNPDLMEQAGDYPLLLASEREYAITRVAYKLGLEGPALSVNTACSTSAVAVHLASQSLMSGESDLALAGGARIRVPLAGGYVYQQDGILSPDGHCRAFDAEARGTVAASGVAIVALKRLSDAVRDGDTIYAIVKGTAVNNDGSARGGFTAPGIRGQAAVIEEALAVAEVSAETIGMLEAHGTGTSIGDPIEVAALSQAFRRDTDRRQYCAIGSLKTNIGHLDAAAGVAGMIKAALALHHEQIPPSLNFRAPNPQLDLDASPFFVNVDLREWPRSEEPRRAGISSFGLGGTNAHMVLEEGPLPSLTAPQEDRPQVLTLSARTESALAQSAADLATNLGVAQTTIDDVAFTLQEGRRPFERRRAVVADSLEEAIAGLRGTAKPPRVAADGAPQVAFLFPGGGSQHLGMAARLYATQSVVREALDRCADVLRDLTGMDLIGTLYPRHGSDEAREALHRVSVALPALYAVEYAVAQLWLAFGIRPSAMIGHSLGEYVAATVAEVFSLETGLGVVAERSRLMEEAPAGAMLSVALPPDEVATYLNSSVSLAVVNSPDNSVISGAAGDVATVAERLASEGVQTRSIPIAVASHSVLMEPVLAGFEEYLRGVRMDPPRLPFISNVTGEWMTDEQATDPAYWATHLRSTVRFADGVRAILDAGSQVLIEVGPGQALTSIVRRHHSFKPSHVAVPSLPHPKMDIPDDRHFLTTAGMAWEAGASVDWAPSRTRERHRRVPLPTYPFEHERFWIEPLHPSQPVAAVPAARAPERATSAILAATPTDRPEPQSRAGYVADQLVAVLSELSGIDKHAVDRTATFLELGFDSLFLTQANSRFKRAFGVNITFRHLFDEAPTVESLARYIDVSLPPDALGAPTRRSDDEQARRPVVAVAAAVDTSPMAPEEGSPVVAARHGPAPGPTELSHAQQATLDALIARYGQRTQGSKAWADESRPVLADNRTVGGFEQLTKELTYLIVAERAEGARLWDIDGNEYVDLTMSFGAALAGHSPPFVVEAMQAQLARGYQVGVQSRLAGDVAEQICELTGNERVTFAHSGSEAVEYAIRIARTVTGRDRVAYFAGDIHGRSDIVLGRTTARDGVPRTLPGTIGIPGHVAADALVLEYGTDAALELIRAHAHELAAVLVEPVRTRNPDLQPRAFLQALRDICDESGALLVFDEVVTGFRIQNGGSQAWFDIRADLATYGKALGAGMPIGAVAGRREYLDVIDGGAWRFGDGSRPEVGMTVSGGTMIKHPLALAAAKAMLEHLAAGDDEPQRALAEISGRFAHELNDHYRTRGIPIHVECFSSFFLPVFTAGQRYETLFFALLRDRGVHIYPAYPCFLSFAHTETDVAFLLDAFKGAADEMLEAGFFEPAADRNPAGRSLPLTDAQRDIWLVAQLSDEASAAYHLSSKLHLQGALDVDALRDALRLLVERHEALRITFDETGEHQVVAESMDVELPVDDLSSLDDAGRTGALEDILASEVNARFDLVAGPLFRARLIRLAEEEHTLTLSAHHLVCDGWSLGIMQRDLGVLYSALRRSEPVRIEDATPFSEYVTWHRDRVAESERFWLDEYADPPLPLDLPTDRARPPVRTFECEQERVLVGTDLLATLRAVAAAEGLTLFTVLLTAWETLLQRLSGQHDFAVGLFVAGQMSMGVRDLVGLCVNFLPLHARLDPGERLSEHLGRLKWNTYEAYDHQHYSVGRLAAALNVRRDASRPTLVSTAVTLETVTANIHFDGLEAATSTNAKGFAAFDLEAYLTESEDELAVDFQYSTALFEPDTIRRWLGYYVNLLQRMTAAAPALLSSVGMLDDGERHDLLHKWNDTTTPIPVESAHQLFERQAAAHPERVAIRTSTVSLSYAELNARANRIARHLRDQGVEGGDLVGVHFQRSPDMVATLLAVHKAGAAYVPLDPLFPPERLAMIVDDATPTVLVTEEALLDRLAVDGAGIVVLERDGAAIDEHDDADPGVTPEPSDLAYVIYTSGSTGTPKGVEVPHVALTNLLMSMRERPGLSADDQLLAVTTISFDIAALELFLPLSGGGTVVLADTEQAVDAMWLRERLAAGDITVMQATPPTWQLLLDVGWSGTAGLKALCGGEALGRDLADAISPRVASLWNMYGPTETTIWSSVGEVDGSAGPVSIGSPIANTELYVLDPSLQPQPFGVPGELYIGGSGLARGYRNQDGLTEERFVTHQFEAEPPRRLYRTGDMVRRYPDGRVDFVGRTDFQVKIRGFRIELGEVETALARHDEVRECVVVARDGADASRRLVAYVLPTAGASQNVTALRTHLLASLPDYMIPSHFVFLDAFPLTANNKIDRQRLPDPDSQRPGLAADLVAPRNRTEADLVRIWEELLDVDHIGIDDNFFDLGGDSMLAMRCIMRANRQGMDLAPVSIFRNQTIAELALVATTASAATAGDQGDVTGPAPLTPAQLRFLTERNTRDPHHWNISALVQAADLDPGALRTAVGAVLSHHDALRLRIWRDGAGWRQEIGELVDDIPFESLDLSRLSRAKRTAAIEQTCAELQASFDLASGPLVRVAHFECGPDQPDRLLVTIHHFAVDGLTWSVFWEDLEQAYRHAAERTAIALPPKTTSFKAWSTQLQDLAQTPRVAGTVDGWLQLPWGEVATLPRHHEAGAEANTNGSVGVVAVDLGAEDTQRLLEGRGRPERVIISALGRSLSAFTSSQTILVDVLSHGRDAAFDGVNLSRTLGYMLSYNPLVLRHPTWDAGPDMLRAVTDQIEASPEGFSFELLRFLSPDAGLRDRLDALPRAEVLFVYDGDGGAEGAAPSWPSAAESKGPIASPRGLRQYPLRVGATLAPDLRLTFVYSEALHKASTIESMAAEVRATLASLLREPASLRR